MHPDRLAVLDAAGVEPNLFAARMDRSDAVQLSIATSLKRLADNLDLVINHNHNTIPSTSIAVSQNKETY